MADVTVTFIGSGDAFGSGGRLQTCILVDGAGRRFVIDFGATSLTGLRQQNIDPNTVEMIMLTHLHGDHCGGIPFLLMDAMLASKRQTPLTILGPARVEDHVKRLQAALFPGSGGMRPEFLLSYMEIEPGDEARMDGLTVKAAAARHTRETHPLALRVHVGKKTIAYTGDGGYSEDLRRLVSGVDLLIAESYFYDKPVKWHLNYPDISRLDARRIVLTHMHSNMLRYGDIVPEETAHDGFQIAL